MSIATLNAIRDQITNYNFSAQYQQRPVPVEGRLVNPAHLKQRFNLALFQVGRNDVYQSWDTAMKSGELNDYSVCTTWERSGHDLYLLDVFRRKLEYPELREAVMVLKARYKPTQILIEDKASGTQLIQDLDRACVYGIQGVVPPPGLDKIMRFRAQSHLFASGRIFLPTEAPWLADYIDEIISFPAEVGMPIWSTPPHRRSNSCAARHVGKARRVI
jgi:predicted phage terminase large subunit-like protein